MVTYSSAIGSFVIGRSPIGGSSPAAATSLNTTLPASVVPYTERITSEYWYQPNFKATVVTLVQPLADVQSVVLALPQCYDLDISVGVQEDADGLWIGRTRYLAEEIDAYFSFDADGLGWDQGIWFQTGDPLTGLAVLYDDAYRTLLRAKIAANNWDGTIPGAYAAWDVLFAGTGYKILIQNYGFMHMAFVLVGPAPDAVTKALFTLGELDLKPAGVLLDHVLPTVYPGGVAGGTPLFGFDAETDAVDGWDVGAWGDFISSE